MRLEEVDGGTQHCSVIMCSRLNNSENLTIGLKIVLKILSPVKSIAFCIVLPIFAVPSIEIVFGAGHTDAATTAGILPWSTLSY